MDYKMSVAIVSVPKRYNLAKRLQQKFSLLGIDAKMCVDVKYEGSWWCHRKAMEAIEPDATHHLVIEEDAVLCKNFKELVYQVISVKPNEIISLFASREQKAKFAWAYKRGYSWFVNDCGAPGVACIFPKDKLADMLTWCDQTCPFDMPYEDSHLWGWMKTRGLLTWNPVPNLVEHGAPMNSSFGFNNKGKVSFDFIGNRDLDIDWSKGSSCDQERVFKYTTGQGTYEQYCKEVKNG